MWIKLLSWTMAMFGKVVVSSNCEALEKKALEKGALEALEKGAFLKNSKTHCSFAKRTLKIEKLIAHRSLPKKASKSFAANVAYI